MVRASRPCDACGYINDPTIPLPRKILTLWVSDISSFLFFNTCIIHRSIQRPSSLANPSMHCALCLYINLFQYAEMNVSDRQVSVLAMEKGVTGQGLLIEFRLSTSHDGQNRLGALSGALCFSILRFSLSSMASCGWTTCWRKASA